MRKCWKIFRKVTVYSCTRDFMGYMHFNMFRLKLWSLVYAKRLDINCCAKVVLLRWTWIFYCR